MEPRLHEELTARVRLIDAKAEVSVDDSGCYQLWHYPHEREDIADVASYGGNVLGLSYREAVLALNCRYGLSLDPDREQSRKEAEEEQYN